MEYNKCSDNKTRKTFSVDLKNLLNSNSLSYHNDYKTLKQRYDRNYNSTDLSNNLNISSHSYNNNLFTTNTNRTSTNYNIPYLISINNNDVNNEDISNDNIFKKNKEQNSNISFMNTDEYINNISSQAENIKLKITEINNLKHNYINVNQSTKYLEKEMENIKEKLIVYYRKIRQNEEIDKKNKETINSLSNKLKTLQKDNSNMKKRINEYEQKQFTLELEEIKLKEKEKMFSTNSFLLSKEKLDLEKQLHEAKEENKNNENLLKERIKDLNSKYQEDLINFEQSFNSKIKELNDQLNIKNIEIEDYSNQIKLLKEDLSYKDKENKEKADYINSIINSKTEENNQSKAKISESNLIIKKLNDRIKDLLAKDEEKYHNLERSNSFLTRENHKLSKRLLSSNDNFSSNISARETRDLNSLNRSINNISQTFKSPNKVVNYSNQDMLVNSPSTTSASQLILSNINTTSNSIYNSYLEKISSLEKQVSYWKDMLVNKQDEYNLLKKKNKEDRCNLESKLELVISSFEEKMEEFALFKKSMINIESQLYKKEDQVNKLDKQLKDLHRKYVNEIALKNEEIYRLKNTCDRIIAKVYSNMEKALL